MVYTSAHSGLIVCLQTSKVYAYGESNPTKIHGLSFLNLQY